MKTSEAVPRIKIQKKNPAGEVTYKYEGDLIARDENSITLEALFDRADMPFQDVVFKTGDRFVEYYYSNRWYNIFAIYDREVLQGTATFDTEPKSESERREWFRQHVPPRHPVVGSVGSAPR